MQMNKKANKSKKVTLVLILIIIVAIPIFTGFIVIQPVGALPDGITIWYFRAGLNLPFITSPDGFSLKQTGQLSLMSRMVSMSAITTAIKDRIIIRLPYSRTLYKISTGGQEFGQ